MSDLDDWIANERKAGKPLDAIRKDLHDIGYGPDEIEAALRPHQRPKKILWSLLVALGVLATLATVIFVLPILPEKGLNEQCEGLQGTPLHNCIVAGGVAAHDTTSCDDLGNPIACRDAVGMALNESSLCATDGCRVQASTNAALIALDDADCLTDACTRTVAALSGTPEQCLGSTRCEAISSRTIETCTDSMCAASVAALTNSPSLCRLAASTQDCYMLVARLLGDPSVCDSHTASEYCREWFEANLTMPVEQYLLSHLE